MPEVHKYIGIGVVTLFFLLAQLVGWLAFGTRPTVPILVGGALILAGGLTITFWRN